MEHTKAYKEFKKQNSKKYVRYPEGAEMYSMSLSKFQQLAKDAKAIYKINRMVSDFNVYLLPRDLYKDGSRLMQGPMVNFLTEMRFIEGKTIIWIKDECHIATSNLDAIAKNYFDATINFSATPKLSRGQYPDVEITDSEAEQCGLIKRVVWGEDDCTVEDAIKQFKKIKTDYRNLLGVNPCLIIQISNKAKADEELENEILPALNNNPELKWMLIVNGIEETLTIDQFRNFVLNK